MQSAKGVIINITGGSDIGLHEANTAAELVQRSADPEANIIFGTVTDDSYGDEIQITVIATGFDKDEDDRRNSTQNYDNIVAEAWKKRNSVVSTSNQSTADNNSNELDIPTFLRKNKGLGGNK